MTSINTHWLSAIMAIFLALMTLTACGSSSSSSVVTTTSDIELIRAFMAKEASAFGISVFGSSTVSTASVQHTATVLAEYLDSDDDGIANDPSIVTLLQSAALLVFTDESDEEAYLTTISQSVTTSRIVVNRQSGVVTPNGSGGQFDETLEEVLHFVTQFGYSVLRSDALGERVGTDIANAMDIARGGQFLTVPSSYPSGAWYTYDDETCDYACMITEYIYWGLTSKLGAQSFPGRLASIQDEWQLNTGALIQQTDIALDALLNNLSLAWPTTLPDGSYSTTSINVTRIR